MTHLQAASVVGTLIVSGYLAGCGGDGGGSRCGQVDPCGGDIRGNWTVVDSCLNSDTLMDQFGPFATALCPTAKIKEATLNATGSFSFNPDRTYAATTATSGLVKLDVPQSCVGGLQCGVLTLAIQLQLSQAPTPGVRSVTCAGDTACVCTILLTPMSTSEAGIYDTGLGGSSLLSTWPATASGIPQSRDYCIEGSTLHFMSLSRPPAVAPGQEVIVADIVAKKK